MHDFNEDTTLNIYAYALTIIKQILGNDVIIEDTFKEFITLVNLNNSDEVLDGGVYKKGTLDSLNDYFVVLPSNTNISAIVCIVHEFIHYFLRRYNIEPKKFYHGEILSILMEKISSEIVQKMGIDQKMVHKIENVRIEALKYHYTEQKEQLKKSNQISHLFPSSDFEYAKKMCNDYRSYYQLLAQSYGIGYLYAESLFCLYQENPQKIITDVGSIITGNKSLEDILCYYDINANNKDVYEKAKNKIRIMTKI